MESLEWLLVGLGVSGLLFVSLLVAYFVIRRKTRLDPSSPDYLVRMLRARTRDFAISYRDMTFGKLLGKGSQGEVYKAELRGTTVAVKKIDARKVPQDTVEEFVQEAEIMRRLRHPALTLFIGVSLEHPFLCIVTELVSRGSLFDILHDEQSGITWKRSLQIAIDIAQGMTYLHAHHPPILHRDLKSLNILVTDAWRAKIADFGMTRFKEQGTMTQCGSPLWMAPEMIRNEAYDEKSDIYSFAICLWELYTRKIPYRNLNLQPSQLVVKVVKENLRPHIPSACPKPFAALIEACWHRDPSRRPTFPVVLKQLETMASQSAIRNHTPGVKDAASQSASAARRTKREALPAVDFKGDDSWKITDRKQLEVLQKLQPEGWFGKPADPLETRSSQEVYRAKFRGMEAVLLRCRLGEVWRNPGTGARWSADTTTPGQPPQQQQPQSSKLSNGNGNGKGKGKSPGGGGGPRPPLTVGAPATRRTRDSKEQQETPRRRPSSVTIDVAANNGGPGATARTGGTSSPHRQPAADRVWSLMRTLSTVRHPNLVLFMGMYAEDDHVGIVVERMEKGTLHGLIHNRENTLEWDSMLQFLVDAAAGLTCLASYRPPLIHEALSTRHLMLTEDLRCKVSDFVFVNLEDKLLRRPPRPNLWSAPEVLRDHNKNSLAANVYSFGIIIWEVMTRQPPFGGAFDHRVMQRIMEGARPPVPASFSPALQDLVTACWAADPAKRPSFPQVLSALEQIKREGPPKMILKAGINARKYVKKKTVFAYRSRDPVTVLKDWGKNVGGRDCWVLMNDDGDVYCMEPDAFECTYIPVVGPGHENEYRKIGFVLARQCSEAFALRSASGTEQGAPGDYLLQNDRGDQWAVSAAQFEALYELAPDERKQQQQQRRPSASAQGVGLGLGLVPLPQQQQAPPLETKARRKSSKAGA